MESWHISRYLISPSIYIMMSATEPLIDQQPSQSNEYGTIDHVDETAEKDTLSPEQHRDTLQKSILTGPAPNVAHFHREPKTYLFYAVLATIFCCFPLGIPAIYYSSKAKRLARTGERLSARRAADRSRTLIQISVSLGFVLWFVALIVVISIVHPTP